MMTPSHQWKSSTAALLSLGLSTALVSPFLAQSTVLAQTRFSDTQGHWAQSCIQSLAQRNIINGYPNGEFRPNAPVTRAEYATMVVNAFPNAARSRNARSFTDVRSNFWAANAIRTASQTGFLTGYPSGEFRPSQQIPRTQVLVSLNNGLGYTPTGSINATLGNTYADASAIPSYARDAIAAATQTQLVVNYPDVRYLKPNNRATRAEVASFLCQALKTPQQASLISGNYIAGVPSQGLQVRTEIPVFYDVAQKVIVSPQETAPLTLKVAQDIKDSQGNIIIPKGSSIRGELQPQRDGTQFVAREVMIDGKNYSLDASSEIITRTISARDPNLLALARNAVLGAGAAAGLSSVIGDGNITAEKVLTGAAVGTAIETNRNRPWLSVARDSALGGCRCRWPINGHW
ncbi:S-layer homology domain-containing protein [Acaryochloris sp. 'Moss Beach']|uniref:S-layer homology domain-containing protein n=1 Tax=Acaryochloris sp. 'Moss Beach' TaxID=2740837 RepID=UPI001F1FDEF2|nr:S-layer homology domain-containing protein [Acaryochloris sp. 'Moss Beach']